jgi:hypothetical protein
VRGKQWVIPSSVLLGFFIDVVSKKTPINEVLKDFGSAGI